MVFTPDSNKARASQLLCCSGLEGLRLKSAQQEKLWKRERGRREGSLTEEREGERGWGLRRGRNGGEQGKRTSSQMLLVHAEVEGFVRRPSMPEVGGEFDAACVEALVQQVHADSSIVELLQELRIVLPDCHPGPADVGDP